MTTKDSIEALVNDYEQMISTFNPKYVVFNRQQVPPGVMLLLKVDVNVPTYVLKQNERNPIFTNGISFYISVPEGYPETKPEVYYGNEKWLASVNVFSNDKHVQCIDTWTKQSSLRSIAEKTLRDIIHDTSVTRYDNMATSTLATWQKSMDQKGEFPTMNPNLLFTQSVIKEPRIKESTRRSVVVMPQVRG